MPEEERIYPRIIVPWACSLFSPSSNEISFTAYGPMDLASYQPTATSFKVVMMMNITRRGRERMMGHLAESKTRTRSLVGPLESCCHAEKKNSITQGRGSGWLVDWRLSSITHRPRIHTFYPFSLPFKITQVNQVMMMASFLFVSLSPLLRLAFSLSPSLACLPFIYPTRLN